MTVVNRTNYNSIRLNVINSKQSNTLKSLSKKTKLNDIEISDANKAQDAMRIIDKAIEEITTARGEMGAFQKNDLGSNLNYLRHAHENVTNAESIIRDADMAEEMSEYARNQILVESSTAMLAQANQTPMAVLKLINGQVNDSYSSDPQMNLMMMTQHFAEIMDDFSERLFIMP